MLLIRSVRLYVDDAGVRVYSGVLPWSRGVAGVKWRDLDEAAFFQGLVAWVTRAYGVHIGHRFTKSNELLLSAMSRGNLAAIEINTRHQAMIRAGAFEQRPSGSYWSGLLRSGRRRWWGLQVFNVFATMSKVVCRRRRLPTKWLAAASARWRNSSTVK